MADIDHFKSVNDTYGHPAGDGVLREFAERLRRNTRGVDLACRMGGEEFIIVMPDTPLERARHVGERVCACIAAEPFRTGGATSSTSPPASGWRRWRPARKAWTPFSGGRIRPSTQPSGTGRNRVVADAA